MTAVVVLTYDAPEGMLERCVASVVASGDASSIFVVDNGNRATSRLRDSACEVVPTGSNLGYAGGMNVGIRLALARGAEAVALLNDDVEVDAGWLGPLEAELADERVGAVQPKLLATPPRADGMVLVNSVGVELGRDGAGRDIGLGEPDGPQFAGAHDLDLFTGGAVLLRAEFLRDVGLFDERFFLYYEDVDLGLRGRRRGWRYRFSGASTVHHAGGVSTSKAAGHTAYLRERNRLWILIRHRPLGDLARGTWLSARRLRHPPRWVHARAMAAGLAAAPRLVLARVRNRS